jgi:serine/threonine protein kinase
MNKILTKSTPNAETLLISLLEDLCYLYEYDENKSKVIFNKICNELSKMGIVSKKSYNDKNKPLRKFYKSILIKLINTIRYNVIDETEEIIFLDDNTIADTPLDLIKVIKSTNTDEPLIKPSTMNNLIKNYSRLHQDFIELEKVGKGGFGKVYKMYHKIDSMLYAVKKIPIENCTINKDCFDKILHEVRSIARLNHQNIIRYYNSWIEYDIYKAEDKELFDSNDSIDNISESENNDLKLTLFIQMELCDMNLKEWLDKRDEYENFDYDHSKNIFKQIVSGLNFIHQNDLIHRDIKPDNIFLFNIYKNKHIPNNKLDDFNYVIKIADFGLSKQKIKKSVSLEDLYEMKKSQSVDTGIKNMIVKKSFNKNINNTYDTSNLGTPTYASPEQLDSYNYDYKTDLYSLGLIMFELFHPHKTFMEKQVNIQNLRESLVFPEEFKLKEEKLIIKKLLQKDPIFRMDTHEILRDYFN